MNFQDRRNSFFYGFESRRRNYEGVINRRLLDKKNEWSLFWFREKSFQPPNSLHFFLLLFGFFLANVAPSGFFLIYQNEEKGTSGEASCTAFGRCTKVSPLPQNIRRSNQTEGEGFPESDLPGRTMNLDTGFARANSAVQKNILTAEWFLQNLSQLPGPAPTLLASTEMMNFVCLAGGRSGSKPFWSNLWDSTGEVRRSRSFEPGSWFRRSRNVTNQDLMRTKGLIGYFFRSFELKKQSFGRKAWIKGFFDPRRCLNSIKIGLLLGIFVDAFKVGS